jgi:hypothetical protein
LDGDYDGPLSQRDPLLVFGLTMAVAVGPKTRLDYSVFTAAAAALLLFAIQPAGGASCTPLDDDTRKPVKCPPPEA